MRSAMMFLQAALIFSVPLCWASPCSSSNGTGLCGFDQVKNLDEALALVMANLSLTLPSSGESISSGCNFKCFDDEVGGDTAMNASVRIDEIIRNINIITNKLEITINKTKDQGTIRAAIQEFRHDQDWLKLKGVLLDVFEPEDLVYRQAQINTWKEGENALLEMIHAGFSELLKVLLDNGLDANMRWKANYATMLHEVAVTGNIDLAELLVSRGAFIDMRAKWEVTPLLRASSAHQPKMVRWLLDHGADVNYSDSNSWTALHFAAKENDPETVKILLDAGIDQKIINGHGLTAYDLAESLYSTKVLPLLTPTSVFENEIDPE